MNTVVPELLLVFFATIVGWTIILSAVFVLRVQHTAERLTWKDAFGLLLGRKDEDAESAPPNNAISAAKAAIHDVYLVHRPIADAAVLRHVYASVRPRIGREDVDLILDAFLESVKKAVAEEGSVKLEGFGTFRSSHQRQARTKRRGRKVKIPPMHVPVFDPEREFEEKVTRETERGS